MKLIKISNSLTCLWVGLYFIIFIFLKAYSVAKLFKAFFVAPLYVLGDSSLLVYKYLAEIVEVVFRPILSVKFCLNCVLICQQVLAFVYQSFSVLI